MKKYREEIEVRFRDLDAYGHVNNAVYLSYFELARINMVKDIFIKDMKSNIQQIVTSAHAEYLQPIFFGDRLVVDCWVSKASKARYVMAYEMHDSKGKIYATGHTEHALFDGNNNRPTRLSPDMVQALCDES